MSELYASPSFGIALTVLVYWVGVKAQKKTGLVICNNMIIAVGLLIAILAVFHIPYEDYNQGGSIINMFLGPPRRVWRCPFTQDRPSEKELAAGAGGLRGRRCHLRGEHPGDVPPVWAG